MSVTPFAVEISAKCITSWLSVTCFGYTSVNPCVSFDLSVILDILTHNHELPCILQICTPNNHGRSIVSLPQRGYEVIFIVISQNCWPCIYVTDDISIIVGYSIHMPSENNCCNENVSLLILFMKHSIWMKHYTRLSR